MKINYVIRNNVLTQIQDAETGKNIGGMTYIEEIRVPESVETIGKWAFRYWGNGDIFNLYMPKSVKLIDSGAFEGRQIESIFYAGSILDLEKVQTKFSPRYKSHKIFCNDGVINFDEDYYIDELNFPGTVAECETLCKDNKEGRWVYRNTKRIHCSDGDIVRNANLKIEQYLKNEREDCPEWLQQYVCGVKPDMKEVLHSKSVYYPGAGMDVQPIETFRKNDIVHLFIYADFSHSKEEVISEMKSESFLYGYNCIGIEELKERDITANGWRQHVTMNKGISQRNEAFGLFGVFEKDQSYQNDDEPSRFALIYLKADGFATYDALFANGYLEPYGLILQDHGWGGNYNVFGAGGLMEEIAIISGKYPKFIECGEDTHVWSGYFQPDNIASVSGGMHHNKRRLWERKR